MKKDVIIFCIILFNIFSYSLLASANNKKITITVRTTEETTIYEFTPTQLIKYINTNTISTISYDLDSYDYIKSKVKKLHSHKMDFIKNCPRSYIEVVNEENQSLKVCNNTSQAILYHDIIIGL